MFNDTFRFAARAFPIILAQRSLQRIEDILFVETEALAVRNVAHVRAEFSIGPQEIANRRQQLLDVIVLFDQFGDIARSAGCGYILERLPRLRIEPHAGDVLRKHRDERQSEALVKIRDELIARHFFECAIVAGALLERQMPVHVVGIPPGVLQSLPEEPRLADPPDLVTARDDAFLAVLPHQLAQRVHQFRLYVFEPLVVRPKIKRFLFSGSASILLAVLMIFGAAATRRQGCRRYTCPGIAIRRGDCAGCRAPILSCGVRVHSASPLPCRQDSVPRRAPLRFHAKPGSDAMSASSTAATAAASALQEIPPAEIPPSPAANL